MPVPLAHPYISKGKRPVITGTRTRVANIVAYYKLGYSAEELAREFPHLRLSHIYDALSFYHENAAKMDREIELEKEENLIGQNK